MMTDNVISLDVHRFAEEDRARARRDFIMIKRGTVDELDGTLGGDNQWTISAVEVLMDILAAAGEQRTIVIPSIAAMLIVAHFVDEGDLPPDDGEEMAA